MTQLDEASNTIPEGFYIQFCDHLQNLYSSEHDEDTDEHEREMAERVERVERVERAELCHRQVMLLVYPIWYLGIAIYYLSQFVYLCLKGIHSIIKAQRESQTSMGKYGTRYVSDREWLGLIGVHDFE